MGLLGLVRALVHAQVGEYAAIMAGVDEHDGRAKDAAVDAWEANGFSTACACGRPGRYVAGYFRCRRHRDLRDLDPDTRRKEPA